MGWEEGIPKGNQGEGLEEDSGVINLISGIGGKDERVEGGGWWKIKRQAQKG